MTDLERQGKLAKQAAFSLASAGTDKKNEALEAIASILMERAEEWLSANEEDLKAAEASDMRSSMLDRLSLDKKRIEGPTGLS